jgi:hypothetical protein
MRDRSSTSTPASRSDRPYWHVPARRRFPHVGAFCERVSPGHALVPVPCEPRLPVARDDCFANAARHAARYGGEVLHGWAVWEIPQIMIEAEFHAVWHRADGELIDVNPRRPHETRITFLPPPERSWSGNAVDNIREALLDDPRVHAFIAQAQKRFDLLKDHPPGFVSVDDAEWAAAFPDAAAIERALFFLAIEHRALKDPCLCGGGRRFGECHAVEFGRWREEAP